VVVDEPNPPNIDPTGLLEAPKDPNECVPFPVSVGANELKGEVAEFARAPNPDAAKAEEEV
jgi:hypothetical protein